MAESTNPISQNIRNDLGTAFQAYTLPVIHRDSITVAVAAPHDGNDRFGVGNSSPDRDGWYHSEMYLCKNLCKDTAQEQYWLTCVDPAQLIKKYGRYLHTRHESGQKIVLNSQELSKHEDMIVVSPRDLRNKFFDTISEQLQKTTDTKRQLIIMIFGDGLIDPAMNFGIYVGGEGQLPSTMVSGNLVDLREIKNSIRTHHPQAQVLLMTTACRTGGWCFSQYINQSNVDGWQPKPSMRLEFSEANLCGAVYACGLANALCRQELINRGSYTEGKVYLPPDGPQFNDLMELIGRILKSEVDDMEPISHPSFQSEHDPWERTWRVNNGFPLSYFKERYEALRTLPVEQALGQSSLANDSSSSQIHNPVPGADMVQIGDGLLLSTGEAYRYVSGLAWHYMRSYPGDSSAGGNLTLHGAINDYLWAPEFPDKASMRYVGEAVTYRLTSMAQANQHKIALGSRGGTVRFCHEFDQEIAVRTLLRNKQNENGRRQGEMLSLIQMRKVGLFDPLPYGALRQHQKPLHYLSHLLSLMELSSEEVLPTIREMKEVCRRFSRRHRTIESLALLDRPGVKPRVQLAAASYERREELRRQDVLALERLDGGD